MTVTPSIRLRAGCFLLLLGGACDGANAFGPEGEPVTPPSGIEAISLTAGTAVLVSLGDTTRVEVRSAGGELLDPRAFRWSSSDAEVVGVDDTGIVTAKRNGSATVRAELEGVSGEASIQVSQAVASLALADTLFSIPGKGQSLELAVDALDARGNPVAAAELTWTSSAPQRIAVSASGVVTAPGYGQARVSVAAGALADQARVRVIGGNAPTIRSLDAAVTTTGTETEPSYMVIRIAATDAQRDLARAEVTILDDADQTLASTVQPGTFGEAEFVLDVHARRAGKAKKMRVQLTDDAGNRTSRTAALELQPGPNAPLLETVRVERVGSDSVEAEFDVTDRERDVTAAWLVGLGPDGDVIRVWAFSVPEIGADAWTGEIAARDPAVAGVAAFGVVLLDRAGNLSRFLPEAGAAAAARMPSFASSPATGAAGPRGADPRRAAVRVRVRGGE
ncbi:hypothetical protein BH23GEM4_BH23GEM4_07210 [soil metagenome]